MDEPDPKTFGLTEQRLQELRQLYSTGSLAVDVGVTLAFVIGVLWSLCVGWIVAYSVASAWAPDSDPIWIWGIGLIVVTTLAFWAGRFHDRREEARLGITRPTRQERNRYERYQLAFDQYLRTVGAWWAGLGGTRFEIELANALRDLGWDVARTKSSNDGGIDIDGRAPDGRRVLIQCKHYSKPCGPAPIRELQGVRSQIESNATAIVACTGDFTKGAREFARASGIKLWGLGQVSRIGAGEAPQL